MVKVKLHDDVRTRVTPWGDVLAVEDLPYQGVPVALAEDNVGLGVETNATLTVHERHSTGYDEDGNQEFAWTTVLSGVACLRVTRAETNDVTGLSKVTATATMLNPADVLIAESAAVIDADGTTWNVTSVNREPGWVGFVMWRNDEVS